MKQKFLSFFFIACALFAWAMPAKADDPDWASMGVTSISDGFYYLYSPQAKSFMKAGGAATDAAQATLFYVEKQSSTCDTIYSISFSYDSNTGNPSIKFVDAAQTNTSYWPATVVWDTISKKPGSTNLYSMRYNAYNTSQKKYLIRYLGTNTSGSNLALNVGSPKADGTSYWVFIPAQAYTDRMIASWGSDTYVQKSTTVNDAGGLYYLYNPALQRFMGNNRNLQSAVASAAVFCAKKNANNSYSITFVRSSSVYYINPATTNWLVATSCDVKLETSVIGGYTYYRMRTFADAEQNIYLSLKKNGTTFGFNRAIKQATFDFDYSKDINSQWVLIPKSEFEVAPELPENDAWREHGVAPGDGGLFCLYHPVAQKFLTSTQMFNADVNNASLFYVDKHVVDANTYYSIASATSNAYRIPQAKYIKMSAAWSVNATLLTVTPTTDNRYTISEISGQDTYYITSDQLGMMASAGISRSNYIYEPDLYAEWVFVPYSYYKEQVTSARESDPILDYAVEQPVEGNRYLLYNVETKRFVQYQGLTSESAEAALCTIGDGAITLLSGTSDPVYLSANSDGWTSTDYGTLLTLGWTRVPESTSVPTYYIYNELLGSDIHIQSKYGSSASYTSTAIKTNSRPDNLGGNFEWAFITPPRTLYYSANAVRYEGKGTVRVSFSSGSVGEASDITDTLNTLTFEESLPTNVYFKAEPFSDENETYQFMGWKTDPLGDFISTEAEYTYNLVASSTDEDHPDNVTLYAYFEKYDAELYNGKGIKKGDYDHLSDALDAASTDTVYTIKLKRNITGPLTINKGVTIDFNGYTISGTIDNLVTINTTDTVTFVDNSTAHNGGIKLSYTSETDEFTAIKVIKGIVIFNSGYYTAQSRFFNQSNHPTVLTRTGGSVRVNGGYFRTYQIFRNDANLVRDTLVFNGSSIQLYGGYYTNDRNDNISGHLGIDMEAIKISDTELYAYTLRNKFDVNAAVATADGKGFASLADAIAYANNNAETEMVIRLAKDHTLPAGNYVIPEKATLIIPYNSLHTEPLIACPLLNNSRLPSGAYRTLTLENGVRIDVYGAIELGGCAYSYGNGATGTGRPNSDYGHMIMSEGSQIILNANAKFRAWGFVTGSGAIDVRRGARVEEMFQVYDFKGGNGTLAMYRNENPGAGETKNLHSAFPINQYYIQNVEVKTTYRPGSALYGTMAAVNVGISVKIIGVDTDDAALFTMNNEDDSEDTWVCKWYNPATDQQVYDINNSAAISNLILPLSAVIGVQGADFNSADYKLPITNNFKIHLLSGDMYITQDVAFLPGSELEIDKRCTGHINTGKTAYFYDTDEWGTYVYNGAFASKIKYRPDGLKHNRNISSAANLGDPKVNIHGTIEVNGGFRTTLGGANIISTNEDAGTMSFTSTSLTKYDADKDTLDTWIGQTYYKATEANGWKASATPHYAEPKAIPALLTNGVGDPTSTATTDVGDNAEKSYCYIENQWRLMTDVDCSIVTDGVNYYIKPQGYVQLSDVNEDGDHLYHDISGTHHYIKAYDKKGNCQTWEVEDVDGHPELKHSIHLDNDVYYYYYDDQVDDANDGWREKRFAITWKNWDGAVLDTYEMKMGAKLQYLGSTPNREKTDYYTYDFAGWSPAIAEDAVVTGDATYTAQFNQTDRKYLITFINGAVQVETQYLKMGQMPTSPASVDMTGKEWKTDAEHGSLPLGPVTGDATYYLQAKSSAPYTIRFVNWDGAVLQAFDGSDEDHPKVAAGTTPVYTGATPIKPSIGDENYTFVGWTPEVVAAAGDAIYVAKFEAQKVTGLNITTNQTISDAREVTDLYVTQTGVLTITGSIKANNFILESNGSTASGQLLPVTGTLNITGHAYFDLKLNAKNHLWYGVAVPWQVDATSGISVNGRTLQLGKDFDIIYYDGARRAAEGKNKCWQYVQNDGDQILRPGRLYMIGLMGDAETIRFEKKDSAALLTTTTSVAAHSSAIATDANWNGVANPALFHAFVNAGADDATYGPNIGQVYNPDTKSYSTIDMSAAKFVVGQGAFVQAPANKAITVTYGGAYAAPRRARAQANITYDVRIAPAEGNYTDRLFVRVEDEKEADKYVIGKDLAKLGVSKSVAQMWINRYNTELCLNTMTIENGVADYPLGISVPAAGDYTITNLQSPITNDQYELYLTKNGEVIWNLSEGAFVLSLEKGTTNAYGLRLNSNKMPTAIDEAVVDAQGQTRKVLINNQIFILRGDKVYSIDGQLVK